MVDSITHVFTQLVGMNKDTFYVLRDAEGVYRPQVLCVRDSNIALKDIEVWERKYRREDGDEIIKVKFQVYE